MQFVSHFQYSGCLVELRRGILAKNVSVFWLLMLPHGVDHQKHRVDHAFVRNGQFCLLPRGVIQVLLVRGAKARRAVCTAFRGSFQGPIDDRRENQRIPKEKGKRKKEKGKKG